MWHKSRTGEDDIMDKKPWLFAVFDKPQKNTTQLTYLTVLFHCLTFFFFFSPSLALAFTFFLFSFCLSLFCTVSLLSCHFQWISITFLASLVPLCLFIVVKLITLLSYMYHSSSNTDVCTYL